MPLAASGLSLIANTAPVAFGALGTPGWKVLHIINNVSASKLLVLQPAGLDKSQGLISTAYFKDPASPDWSDDASMKEFKDALAKYEPRANPEDPNCVFGFRHVALVTTRTARAARGREGAERRLHRQRDGHLRPGRRGCPDDPARPGRPESDAGADRG